MVKIGVVADDFTGTASSGMMMAKAQVETGLFFDAATVTVQVAASVVVSCILAPIITSWWAKKHGCPKMPLEGQEL